MKDNRPLTQEVVEEIYSQLDAEGFLGRFDRNAQRLVSPITGSYTPSNTDRRRALLQTWREMSFQNTIGDIRNMLKDYYATFSSFDGALDCVEFYFNRDHKEMDEGLAQAVLSSLKNSGS